MALLTTMPASEMIPMPVMITTKSMLNVARPPKTPMVLKITLAMMISGRMIELNWVTRMIRMSERAMSMARERNSIDSFWSCCSPVKE